MAQGLLSIQSTSQFSSVLSTHTVVIADFYADWCGPCKQIAPIYEQLSKQWSKPGKVVFTKINTDQQQDLAAAYGVRAMPTFMIFKNAQKISSIEGADQNRLREEVTKACSDTFGGEGSSGASGFWLGSGLPRGYSDVTDNVDMLGLELLNWDSSTGNARTLFSKDKPKGEADGQDFVTSDTDEQLMLYIPFQSTLKVHTIHVTSHPPESDDDESPSRPALVKLFINRPHILGFDDAEDIEATQEITLSEKDWDPKTGTAKLELRFVKFQNITSLVMFVVESEGDNEKVRIDRIRIIGETGEKRDGKIEKIASDD